ncbi:SgrR family transcriptional regulator [Photobacterium sp. OFAV2-7]|uniref:SgrR family transcriptional regulator n=1 Tax=Photobacterium sp. OFAV2-7 TaxID=2917748 RepID=UPI001EF556D5|nr:SgrR family transcriptional regulator [Photobacterium sp. OFAV2-7]
MLKDKLLLYYTRTAKLGVKKEILITLHDVAEAMFTSPRHSRTLLKEMHTVGWLEWVPKVGRNQRSLLHLKYSPDELRADLAKQHISIGKYEKALALIDNDQVLFGQLLQTTSGASRREGLLHIQLTYRRSFSPILPHIVQRNSERFFLRQVYSCLTCCDENGNLTPQLAHHWTYYEETCRWRFFLRPQLSFHDGSEINADKVAELFIQLKALPEYHKELAHMDSVSAINPHCVEFALNQPDPGFAGLVSDVRYSIQPASQLDQAAMIVGSGAFQIKEHSSKRLHLQAFDNYYGCRALTDSVTVWQVASKSASEFGKTLLQADIAQENHSSCSHYVSISGEGEGSEESQQTRIENGCLLMLFNHQSGVHLMQRKYLAQLLSTDDLMAKLRQLNTHVEAVPASNLLPGWTRIYRPKAAQQRLPKRLTVAVFEHQALVDCSKAISDILGQAGVECQVKVYSFEEFHDKARREALSEDLILTSLNLDDNRPTSAFRWMLSNSVLHQCLSPDDSHWLDSVLTSIRKQSPLRGYLSELDAIATAMLNEHWLMPLFHHRQTLRFEGILKGVSMTAWGWPAIQDVWSED